MILELPDPIAERLSTIAQQRGYESAIEFITELVMEELDSSCASSQDDIDELLTESLNGGPSIPDSPELRQRMIERAKGVA